VVSGTPKGAKLTITGPKDFAVTKGLPVTIQRAPRGEYKVTASRSGYVTTVFTRRVRPGGTTSIQVDLPKSSDASAGPPVRLMIGTPGIRAQVRVDGKAVGPTPVAQRAPLLSPGRHVLDLIVHGRTYSYTVIMPKAKNARGQRLIIRKLGEPVGGAVKAIPR
jgi:hypothetical protein